MRTGAKGARAGAVLAAAVMTSLAVGAALTAEEQRGGWRLLWDGRTADGWRGAKAEPFPPDAWRMSQGELSVRKHDPAAGWRGADIVTRERFSDFELVVEFKLSPGANSGIKYFVDAGPGLRGKSSLGLEYQLVDDERHPDARLGRNGNRKLAALYDLFPASEGKPAKPPGEWNEARIVARGGNVEHWLNGEKVLEYDRFSEAFRRAVAASKYAAESEFGLSQDGHILLQDHGDEVTFRNVKVRALGSAAAAP